MAVFLMPYKIISCGLSHQGLVRQNNEDVWAEAPEARFFVLADGMGGHRAGEIAAREAVSVLCRVMEEKHYQGAIPATMAGARREVRHAIELANYHVFKMGRNNPELKGMGTTVCCLYFHDQGVIYGHVGDSRIYRFRHNMLEQITRDDSLLRELIDQGQLSESQAPEFMYKNIITKAIGAEPSVEPAVHYSNVMHGDIYVMCTDGLTDLLSIEEIAAILSAMESLKGGAEKLIEAAIAKGGHDNITVVMMMAVKEEETEGEGGERLT